MAIRVATVLESSNTRVPQPNLLPSDPLLGADYTIQSKQVDAFRDEVYGDWEGIVHPSGVMYYFSWKTKTYTGTDIKRCSRDRLHNLNNWIHAARRRLQEDTWFLVVEPVAKQDGDHYEYYCADTKQHVVAWFDVFDASLLFQECGLARLELEAQFWKHVDFFPRHYEMRPSDANELRAHLEWFLADSRFIFGRNRAESHLSSNDLMTEQGVAFCGSWIRSSSILNYYGLPEARLMRSHSVEGFKRKRSLPLLLATAAMFGVPALVLEHIENIHVDGIVNSLDIRQFVDRFNDDNVKHSTLVSLLDTSVKR
ncbi:hypothetical protein DFJ58DRAFT_849329 [Suillus subalutaceus]|uniref:uncharacterized protein n=1 Tax=Suillus subalutaceus TaxID=48586 RepID=UPI001B86467F|nr:uncharacterized protein DFJ58DRAFT_849329 [Suillus subalutaceus]KAG1827840.1 hypothetical protein DFJ58DRAFT_849329 [Suillus subalutaceus]